MLTNSTAKSTRMQSQFKSVMEKRHTMAMNDQTRLQLRQDLHLDKINSSNPQLGKHFQNSLTKQAKKQSLPDNLLNINSVDNSIKSVSQAISKWLKVNKIELENPGVITKAMIVNFIRDYFGLKVTSIQALEAKLVCEDHREIVQKNPSLEEAPKLFDAKKFANWLHNNIPFLHPLNHTFLKKDVQHHLIPTTTRNHHISSIGRFKSGINEDFMNWLDEHKYKSESKPIFSGRMPENSRPLAEKGELTYHRFQRDLRNEFFDEQFMLSQMDICANNIKKYPKLKEKLKT